MASTSGEGDVPGQSVLRKNVSNPSNWKKNTAKRKRNAGEEYVGQGGKVVVKRKIGAQCNDGCFEKLGMDNVKAIHDSFWALADFNIQNNFIQKYCVKGEVKRRRVQQRGDGGDAYKRKCTRAYSLSCGGTNISVCATAFRNVLGVTSRRVYNAVDRVNPTGTPRADRRGKHVPKHAMPLSRKNLVECHIKSFPTVSSHYTRAKSPLMRYLDTKMTMKKMYFLYKEWLFDNHEDEEPVTFSYYKKVVQGFRLGFKPPSTDTCSKCDRYEVSKKDANTEEEAQGIQAQWDEHLSFAKEGMKAMADMQNSDSDSEDIVDDPQPLQDEDNTGEDHQGRKKHTSKEVQNIDGSTPPCSASRTPAGPLSIASVSSEASPVQSPGLSSTGSSEHELLLDKDMDLKLEIKEEVVDDALREFVKVLDHVEEPPDPKEDDVDVVASTSASSSNIEFVDMIPHQMEIPSDPKEDPVDVLAVTKPSSIPSTSSVLLKKAGPAPLRVEDVDEFQLFGMFVASQLRALPLRDALQAQLEIQTLLAQKRSQRLT